MSDPRYITIKAAEARYGVSRSTIYELLRRGHVRSVKHGRRRLVRVESADAWFDNLPEAKLGKMIPGAR
jgi:excisionase family DNA binding protein